MCVFETKLKPCQPDGASGAKDETGRPLVGGVEVDPPPDRVVRTQASWTGKGGRPLMYVHV